MHALRAHSQTVDAGPPVNKSYETALLAPASPQSSVNMFLHKDNHGRSIQSETVKVSGASSVVMQRHEYVSHRVVRR